MVSSPQGGPGLVCGARGATLREAAGGPTVEGHILYTVSALEKTLAYSVDSQSSYPKKGSYFAKNAILFDARCSTGLRWFSIDSSVLKSMAELWFDSFKTRVDRDHREGHW